MKKKTAITELQPGMYVAELDRPWLETPFMFQGFFIQNQQEIDELGRYCQFVYVDTEIQDEEVSAPAAAGKRAAVVTQNRVGVSPDGIALPTAREDYHIKSPFEVEFTRAFDLHQRAREQVYNMHFDVRMGKSISADDSRRVVREMVASVVRNPDAQLWLAQLGKHDESSAEHSLAVCILSLAFARHLGLDQQSMAELGLGALMHDIGKMRVPEAVVKKTGVYNDNDRREMCRHPVYSREILLQVAGLPQSVIDVAWCHHEKADGSGYPRGLKRHETPLYARMVELVDSYEAMTSSRTWRKQMSPYEALSQMYSWRGERYDNELVEQFIQCLGIYPVGSLVELVTGEVGIVMASARSRRLLPKVLLVLGREKNRYPRPRVLDMKHYYSQTRDENVKIRTVLPPGAHDIQLQDFIKLDEWFVS